MIAYVIANRAIREIRKDDPESEPFKNPKFLLIVTFLAFAPVTIVSLVYHKLKERMGF